MTLLVPNNGEEDAMKYLLNFSAAENVVLRLYSNNVTPSETDVAATYTETDFAGYAAVTLTGASWVITPGAPCSAAYAKQTFTSNTAQSKTLYGYYLTRLTSGRIAWAERFSDAPITITNNLDKVDVTPTITAD